MSKEEAMQKYLENLMFLAKQLPNSKEKSDFLGTPMIELATPFSNSLFIQNSYKHLLVHQLVAHLM